MLATHYDPNVNQRKIVIDVDHVSHVYGSGEAATRVLHDNQLTVRSGEVVIIRGQSGSGKTTLLTLIGTLRRVQQGGKLHVLDVPLHDSSDGQIMAVRRKLGFIFQAHNLFSSLTALENVRMALELQPGTGNRRQQNDRCREMLDAVGLGDRIHYRPSGLSGGQKQRVAVARGLVHHPQIVLADEPTAALDKGSGEIVVNLFKKYAKEHGTAVLVVTHDKRVLQVADRTIFVNFGKIAVDARLDEATRIARALSSCSVFQNVSVSTLKQVATVMLAEHFPAATRIIKQGDVGDKFYFIREGHVTVRREGVEAPIANLGPGDFFGEAALIKGESRNAHVDADENVVLFTLNKDQFTKAIDNQPTIDEEIRKALFDDQ